VEGLSQFRGRWPLARESTRFDEEIRQLHYGKRPHVYRVLFIIRDKVVHVLDIRHGARDAMATDDVILPGEKP
jgi:hypothetical protein